MRTFGGKQEPQTVRTIELGDLAIRRPWFPRAEAYTAQLQGILAWESYSRLSAIAAPTLVIHGEFDRLVPPGNGKLIAEVFFPYSASITFTSL